MKTYPLQKGTDIEIISEILQEQNRVPIKAYINPNSVMFQLWGYCVILHDDGTWTWEDTSGG